MAFSKPTEVPLYRAVRLGRIFPLPALRFLAWAGAFSAAVFLALWIAGIQADQSWHGAMLAALVGYLALALLLFSESYRAAFVPPEADAENLAAFLDYEALRIVSRQPEGADLAHLLVPMLGLPGMTFVLTRIGMTLDRFRHELLEYLHATPALTADPLPVFLESCRTAQFMRARETGLTWYDLFAGLASASPFVVRMLRDAELEAPDLRTLLDWAAGDEARREQAARFWSEENLMRTRGIGKDWTAGYASHLEAYAVEMNRYAGRGSYSPRLYGRAAETEAIERILARDGKNNVVLVGEPGVGKMITVSSLAERIALGETLASLAHKRVLRLSVGALTAGADEAEIEERLRGAFADAARAGNIILVIDDIHDLFGGSHALGTVDASAVVLPFLTGAQVQVVGLTTYEGYHETIARRADVARAFEEVEIREPSRENTYAILRDVIPHIEAHDHAWVLYQAVKAAVELSDRYIKNAPFPEKAIDLLQEAAVLANTKDGTGIVTAEHIASVVEARTQVPVGELAGKERDTLLNLEAALHARVIGQDAAIAAIASAMRRGRVGISSAKRPIGSFLFLGPTGVGKTETAKALAAAYFGSEERMARFDMSEYQDPDSIWRLIGHGSDGGALTTAVMDHPFSLVLLDEIEKAHPDILNVFLQVLDDGRLTDALGRTVDFTSAIVIATSNAGAELIRESVTAGATAGLSERVLETLEKDGTFRPEFLNRFDAIVMFSPLDEGQLRQVAELLIKDLNTRLKEKGIAVAPSEDAVSKLVALGYDPAFGARPLRRVLQDKVEDLVAKKLLAGELSRGDTLTFSAADL